MFEDNDGIRKLKSLSFVDERLFNSCFRQTIISLLYCERYSAD